MSEIIQGAGKSKLRRYFVTALLLALVITGGLFAYAYTTATTSLSVTGATADYASITTNMTVPSYNVFGSYRGAIQAGTLFNVTPDTNYTGDIGINVYLDNIDEIGYKYGFFLVKVQLVDSGGSYVDVEGLDKPLSMNNGMVSFVSTNMTGGTTYYIKVTGGVYRAFPWAYLTGAGGAYAPSFTAEVVQAGL